MEAIYSFRSIYVSFNTIESDHISKLISDSDSFCQEEVCSNACIYTESISFVIFLSISSIINFTTFISIAYTSFTIYFKTGSYFQEVITGKCTDTKNIAFSISIFIT